MSNSRLVPATMSSVRRESKRYNVGNNFPAEAAPGKGSITVISSISPIVGISIWKTCSACSLGTCFHMLHPKFTHSAFARRAHYQRCNTPQFDFQCVRQLTVCRYETNEV